MSTAAPYNRDLVTAALMGFTAGYTTANTKVRFNTFGGMMTGNTVKVGISLQQKEWGCTLVVEIPYQDLPLQELFAHQLQKQLSYVVFLLVPWCPGVHAGHQQ